MRQFSLLFVIGSEVRTLPSYDVTSKIKLPPIVFDVCLHPNGLARLVTNSVSIHSAKRRALKGASVSLKS